MKNKILALMLFALAACSTPHLPDPSIKYPTPPEALMTTPTSLEKIPS